MTRSVWIFKIVVDVYNLISIYKVWIVGSLLQSLHDNLDISFGVDAV